MIIQLTLASMQLDRMVATAHAAEIHEPLTVTELKQFARTTALNNQIDPEVFIKVATCESGFVSDIRSRAIHDGIQENSWGIFQINLAAHLDVTREQATDPFYNITWAAAHWPDASHHWKTCYKVAIELGK